MPRQELDGRRVYYSDGGVAWQPGRPTIALVHGAGMTHSVWQQQARALAHAGCNVCAPDLPGHGYSADADGMDSVEAYADWLGRLLGALGATPGVLVGHSLGAAVALTRAARAPEATTGLAMLGARLELQVAPRLLADLEQAPERAVEFITAFAHGRGGHVGGNTVPGQWLAGGSRALLQGCDPAVLLRDFRASDAWRGRDYAPQVRCPALVVAGREDRMTPAKAGRELADALPDARYVELPDTGHMLQTEAPRTVLRLLREFVLQRPAA